MLGLPLASGAPPGGAFPPRQTPARQSRRRPLAPPGPPSARSCCTLLAQCLGQPVERGQVDLVSDQRQLVARLARALHPPPGPPLPPPAPHPLPPLVAHVY